MYMYILCDVSPQPLPKCCLQNQQVKLQLLYGTATARAITLTKHTQRSTAHNIIATLTTPNSQ